MRKMAKDMDMSHMTMVKAVKDLGMVSRVLPLCHLLTEQQKEKRLERCKKMLTWMKHHRATVKIFSDKKMFTVDQAFNCRNDRWVGPVEAEAIPVQRTKHPQGIMVLGVVASDGKKMLPHFFDVGLKVNTEVYLNVLQDVWPWLHANYPDGNYIWQQDGAPAHTSRRVQSWLKEHFSDFWPSTFWPASSPDLNLLDFAVWGIVEKDACAIPHRNGDNLKADITRTWGTMSTDFVIKSCQAVQPCCEAIVKASGGHIE